MGGSIDTSSRALLRLDRLQVKCGLAASATDGARKLKQGSVRIDNEVINDPRIILTPPPPKKLALRVGKQLRVAVVSW
jgi:tyrosyl-tRNA synthetase